MILPMNEKIIVNAWTHKIFYYKNCGVPICSWYCNVKDFQFKLFAIRKFVLRKNPKSYNDVLKNFKKVFKNILFCS